MENLILMYRFLFVLLLVSSSIFAQKKIEVADNSFGIPPTQTSYFYYGFSKGDQVIINFEETSGTKAESFELIEYPSSLKLIQQKIAKIKNKTVLISETGVYLFKISNPSSAVLKCKLKLQRIPQSEASQDFNTTVYWKNISDTTYKVSQERYVVKTDTAVIQLVDQIAKVGSKSVINSNAHKTIVDFILPVNTFAWSYYIGVGTEGKKAFNQSREKLISGTAVIASKFEGYGTMAALALYGINMFNQAQGEDNVQYWLISDDKNLESFKQGKIFKYLKQGNVINDASQMKSPLSGKNYLALLNDNLVEPIDVIVKVTAVTATPTWGTREVRKVEVELKKVPYLKVML